MLTVPALRVIRGCSRDAHGAPTIRSRPPAGEEHERAERGSRQQEDHHSRERAAPTAASGPCAMPADDERSLVRRRQGGRLGKVGQLGGSLAGRGTLLRCLGEAAFDERGELRRAVGAGAANVRHRLAHVPHRHCVKRRALVRRPARQQLEEDAAKRVHVGGRANALTASLFGCDVRARPQNRPRVGAARRSRRAGDAEVGHLRDAVCREQDVLRLDVAVHDTVRVCARERARDRGPDLGNVPER